MQRMTADDTDSRPPDLVAENVDQFEALFPEAFTDGKVDFEVLKQLLGGSIGAGTLLVCLAPQVGGDEVERLALSVAAWRKELAPAGDTSVAFRDGAFADDVAKSNLTAILQPHGLENVRSL